MRKSLHAGLTATEAAYFRSDLKFLVTRKHALVVRKCRPTCVFKIFLRCFHTFEGEQRELLEYDAAVWKYMSLWAPVFSSSVSSRMIRCRAIWNCAKQCQIESVCWIRTVWKKRAFRKRCGTSKNLTWFEIGFFNEITTGYLALVKERSDFLQCFWYWKFALRR